MRTYLKAIVIIANLNFNITGNIDYHVMKETLTGTHWVNYVTDANWSLMMED